MWQHTEALRGANPLKLQLQMAVGCCGCWESNQDPLQEVSVLNISPSPKTFLKNQNCQIINKS